MNLFNCDGNKLPEYYKEMYLDGYTPEQIIQAAHNTMIKQYEERQLADEVKITGEVNTK